MWNGNEFEEASALVAAVAAVDAASSVLMTLFRDDAHDLDQWEKSPGALVTEADIASDREIAKTLKENGAIGTILSEESVGELGSGSDGEEERTWLIDPLCGTVPFSTGMSHWGINIALRCNGDMSVAAMSTPVSGETLSAVSSRGAWLNGTSLTGRSPEFNLSESAIGLEIDGAEVWAQLLSDQGLSWVKRVGQSNSFSSAAYPLMQVCRGRMAGVVFYNIEPMHLAAGSLIAQELGVIVTDGQGDAIDWSTDDELSIVAVGWPSVHSELVSALNE